MVFAVLRDRQYKKAMVQRLNAEQADICVPGGGQTEEIFTQAMFMTMGKIAKSDGRVTRVEIQYADTIMQLMGLSAEQCQQAIAYFDQGKQKSIDLGPMFLQLAKYVGKRTTLANLFLKIQCRTAYAKGKMHVQEKVLLRHLAEALGFDRGTFESIRLQMQHLASGNKPKAQRTLEAAYEMLDVAPTGSDEDLKKSYRRLMNLNHPDKLAARGMQEHELKQAENKTHEIQQAYEEICRAHKSKGL
ncbi:MAG: co-chaperone DjlA [Pseudomonadales bacterium]